MKNETIQRPVSFHQIHDEEMGAVMNIAQACFAEIGMEAIGTSRLPKWSMGLPIWDETVLMQYLGKDDRNARVMTVGGNVVGYLFYTPRSRAVVIDQIAVDPKVRRNGYATKMMTYLKRSIHRHRSQSIGLKVAEENLGTQLFLRQNGFRWFRTVEDPVTRKDCYLMHWKQSVS